MTVQQHIERMEEMFGELPDPIHEPIRFSFYVKLYRYYTNRLHVVA
jgi:hypothetical protein